MRRLHSLGLVCAASAISAITTRSALPFVLGRCHQPFVGAAHLRLTRAVCSEPEPEVEPTPFAELDVRVGKILEAWEHPDSDKLWCERIDVGEAEPREIASGLRSYYATAEELTGRSVLVVCNLKPAKLAGFASDGMVLCASNADRSTVAFVEPPLDSVPGDRVLCEGLEAVPPASANRVKKKKLMEKAAEELKTVGTIATYKGMPLRTAAGVCKSPSVETGTIS
ncbi:hypothetical protein AB1Y20_011108 [Prymnesium parvum]|uniref:tRNA-binding domain-containing protein n=1 Tax=Prymnesium parvum TaxID=97485 RepID=A0AB34ILP3_PRYPA